MHPEMEHRAETTVETEHRVTRRAEKHRAETTAEMERREKRQVEKHRAETTRAEPLGRLPGARKTPRQTPRQLEKLLAEKLRAETTAETERRGKHQAETHWVVRCRAAAVLRLPVRALPLP